MVRRELVAYLGIMYISSFVKYENRMRRSRYGYSAMTSPLPLSIVLGARYIFQLAGEKEKRPFRNYIKPEEVGYEAT